MQLPLHYWPEILSKVCVWVVAKISYLIVKSLSHHMRGLARSLILHIYILPDHLVKVMLFGNTTNSPMLSKIKEPNTITVRVFHTLNSEIGA